MPSSNYYPPHPTTQQHADGLLDYSYSQSYHNQHSQHNQQHQQQQSKPQQQRPRLSLPPPVTTTVPQSIPSPMVYSPIQPSPNEASYSLGQSEGPVPPSAAVPSFGMPASGTSSSGYRKSLATHMSASSSTSSIASSSSTSNLMNPNSGGAFGSPSLSHSQSYQSGLGIQQQQQQQQPNKVMPSPTASMNPYVAIPEEPYGPTPTTRHYPHHSHNLHPQLQNNQYGSHSGHYRHPSLPLSHSVASPVSNPNAPAPTGASAAALKRASYGSASSLMSYEDSPAVTSSYSTNAISSLTSGPINQAISNVQQQHSPTNAGRLHFNPHSSPRLQQNQASQTGYSTIDPNVHSSSNLASSNASHQSHQHYQSDQASISTSSSSNKSSHSRNPSSSLSPSFPMNTRPMSYGTSWVSPAVTPLSKTINASVPGSVPGSINLKMPSSLDTAPSSTNRRQSSTNSSSPTHSSSYNTENFGGSLGQSGNALNKASHLLSPLFPSSQPQQHQQQPTLIPGALPPPNINQTTPFSSSAEDHSKPYINDILDHNISPAKHSRTLNSASPQQLPPLQYQNLQHKSQLAPYPKSSSRQSMSAQQSALMAATSQHRLSTGGLSAMPSSTYATSSSTDHQADLYFRNSTGGNPNLSYSPTSPLRQNPQQSSSSSASTISGGHVQAQQQPHPSIATPNSAAANFGPTSPNSYYSSGAPPMLSRSGAAPPIQATPATTTPAQMTPVTAIPVPPTFNRIRSKSDLVPILHEQPKFRRALPEGGTLSPLAALTKQLSTTYHICNPEFNYQSSKNPRRILTKPSEGVHNNGFDNSESDYILYVNDILGVDEKRRYLVLDILGHGTFGQVAKCQNMMTKEILAVKVIKSKPAYLKQSMMEVSILDHLNNQVDKNNEHNLLRLRDKFMHKNHLCLVFELLSSNLYELIKRNQFRGLSTNLVRVFAQQLLDSLKVLKEAKIIHCDLKPENILLKSINSPVIKVIDFGSACHELQTVYTYIQSRFYRSPEVLLGLPYTTSIDMWSLGCIVAELFLGLPIFPGTSEYNQLSRIIDTLGNPPNWMVEMGKASFQFMEMQTDEYGRKRYNLKSREKYSEEFQSKEEPSKQYFPSTNLDEIIMNYPLPRQRMNQQDVQREMANRESFLDFVKGLLNMNPFERWTPHQAAMHPFITEKKFTGPFVPNLAMRNYGREKDQSVNNDNYPNSSSTAATVNTSQQPAAPRHVSGSYSKPQQLQPQQQQQQQPSQPQQISSGQAPLLANNDSQSKMYYGSTSGNSNSTYGASGSGLSSSVYGTASTSSQKNLGYQPRAAQAPTQAPMQQPQQQPQQQRGNAALSASWSASSRRPRASTIGNMDPIPPPIQRATALMNPAQPIRALNSPAYIPPPEIAENAQHHYYGSTNQTMQDANDYGRLQQGQQHQQNYLQQSQSHNRSNLGVQKVRQPSQGLSQQQQHQSHTHSELNHSANAYGRNNANGQLQQQQHPQQGQEGDVVRNLEKASIYWN